MEKLPLNLAHVVYFKVKPCLHINTSDMKPEPLPTRTSQEHGAEYVDTSLFISAAFYFNVMEWETEELAGLNPTTVRPFQGNREGPYYRLAASLESMCRGYPPPPPGLSGIQQPGCKRRHGRRPKIYPPAWERLGGEGDQGPSWTVVSNYCQSSQCYYSVIPFMNVIKSHGKAVTSGGLLRPQSLALGHAHTGFSGSVNRWRGLRDQQGRLRRLGAR